ncbi:hypothetical protein Bca101_023021 [Brassica carinata]
MNKAAAVSGAIDSTFSLTDAVGSEALNMQKSSGINNMRLPTSPNSFSPSNFNIPGSLVLDRSPSMQHLFQQQQQAASSKQDKQQHFLHQLIQRHDLAGRNLQLQALVQQQILQSMSPSERLQLQQQQLLRQQQGTQQIIPPNVRPYEAGVCARKLMMYLYHLQQRPAENCITSWKKFVAEYFSPRAKQRLCLSQYESAGQHALGVFPQAAPDMWQCDLCGTKSGKGFEATFDVLARLNEIKFASGIIDELLYLDLPRENRFSNGLMLLEYRKAVQETVHEQFRVVREGHLRIIFSQDLKVNQLLQVAQKCQSMISASGSERVSQQNLKSNSNMVLGAGRRLAKFMELQSLNDLGYPKRYIRTLQVLFSCSCYSLLLYFEVLRSPYRVIVSHCEWQISEVVKSMKDVMNFTGDHKIGAIEGLKRLLEQTATVKLQRQKMQEMEQLGNGVALNGSSQVQMALTSGTMNGLTGDNNNNNSNNQTVGRGAMNGSAQAAAALTNYQSMLTRQNAMNNPNSNTCKQEGFSSQNSTSNQSPSSSSHQMQQQQRTVNGAPNMLQHIHPHHLQPPPHTLGNNQEQQMLHKLLQEMSENRPSVQQQQAFSGQSGGNINAERNPTASTSSISGGGRVPSRNNSFTAASNNNLHLSKDISVTELSHDFSDDGFFNNSDIYGSSLTSL